MEDCCTDDWNDVRDVEAAMDGTDPATDAFALVLTLLVVLLLVVDDPRLLSRRLALTSLAFLKASMMASIVTIGVLSWALKSPNDTVCPLSV